MRIGDDGELIFSEPGESDDKAKRKRKSQASRWRTGCARMLFPLIFFVVGSLGGFAIYLARNPNKNNAQSVPQSVCAAHEQMISVAGASIMVQPVVSESAQPYKLVLSMDGHSSTWISLAGNTDSLSLAADGIHVVESRHEQIAPYFFIFTWMINNFGQPDLQVLTDGHYPSWSPDGKQIAFFKVGGSDSSALYVMNADGSNSRQLRKTRSVYAPASWSPDSSQLAFSTTEFQGTSQNLYVINVNDGSEYALVNSGLSAEYPSWSPDGKSIAYVTHDIYTVQPDGSNRHNLTNGSFSTIGNVGWSPDSKNLAFLAYDKNYQQGVYVMDSDGMGVHRIYTPCG